MEETQSTDVPDQVEIVPTANQAIPRRRWRRGHDTPALSQPGPSQFDALADTPHEGMRVSGGPAPASGVLSTERGRLIVIALSTAAIGIVIGWVIGREGSAGEQAARDATLTTRPATTDARDDVGEEVPPIASLELDVGVSTTVARPGPSTTAPEAWVDGVAEVDPRVASASVELIALTTDGVIAIDLADRLLSTFTMPIPGPGLGAARGLFAGNDWIVVYNPELQRADLLEGREPRRPIPLGTNSQLVHHSGADTFLTLEQTDVSGSATTWIVRSVPFDGSDPFSETVFEVPGTPWVQAVDGDGQALLLGTSGGFYQLDAGRGSRRLSTGALLAFDSATLVIVECGETLGDCPVVVVDRATGERRQVPKAIGAPSTFEPAFGDSGMLGDSLSPTGQYTAVYSSAPNAWSFGLLALDTGEFIPFTQPTSDPMIEWSPDGRFAFFIDNGKLNAFDTVERTLIPDVSPSLSRVLAFTTRPAA